MSGDWKAGLEDVIATRSAICAIDGAAGRLYYRGYEIGELASAVSFEAVTHLLWFGELPGPDDAGSFAGRLAAARGLPAPVLAMLRALPRSCHPLDALRSAVSLAAAFDPDVAAADEAANLRKACRLMALVPATVAAWHRMRQGLDPVPDRPESGHAAHFLYLLDGREPTPEVTRVMDTALTLHADHELNASTFAARVAVATLADLHAAVVAAIATLKGPRHGGANEDVLEMLREIGEPERAEAFVEARLGARAGRSRQERADPPVPGPRLRAPGLQGRRRPGPGPARHGEVDGRGDGTHAALRGGRARVRDDDRAHRPAGQRGLLLGGGLRRPGDPARLLHVHLRGGADRRLVRPRPRAVRRQSPDPAARRVRRPAAAAARLMTRCPRTPPGRAMTPPGRR